MTEPHVDRVAVVGVGIAGLVGCRSAVLARAI